MSKLIRKVFVSFCGSRDLGDGICSSLISRIGTRLEWLGGMSWGRTTLGILLILTADVSAASPFQEIPSPVAGPSLLAALASDTEVAREPTYARYRKEVLREIYSKNVLGERANLDLAQLKEIYDLVLAATAVDVPQTMCVIEPRHYFEYTSEYGKVDVLMCFQCGRVIINVNDWSTGRSLAPAFQAKLNAILEKHGVPTPVFK